MLQKLEKVLPNWSMAPLAQMGPVRWAGPCNEEPGRVGQHRHRDAQGGGEPRRAWPAFAFQLGLDAPPPIRPPPPPPTTRGDAMINSTSVLTKNCSTTSPATRRADDVRRATLTHQELVQGQHQEWGDGQEGDVQLVVGQLGDQERREPVDESAEDGGRHPGHPSAKEHEHGQSRQDGGQGQGHVHGRDRAEQQGHRRQHHAQRQHAGVVEEVDAGRVEQPLRVPQAVPVGEWRTPAIRRTTGTGPRPRIRRWYVEGWVVHTCHHSPTDATR